MSFNLFDNEEMVVEQATRALDRIPFGSEESRGAYENLLAAYKKSFRSYCDFYWSEVR
ncbi:hypothetical protein WCLP8_4120009 [uncultured Gammaproteobacteria bacterium]